MSPVQMRGAKKAPAASGAVVATSDLSIDEILLLRSAGWKPVDLVCGVGYMPIGKGCWLRSGDGDMEPVTTAHNAATAQAEERLRKDCREVGGSGVISVAVEIEVSRFFVKAVLAGTAVRAVGRRPESAAFSSDLSVKDFIVLANSGWQPRGLVFGSGFVQVKRRAAGDALAQVVRSAELTNVSSAMYAARDEAIGHLRKGAARLGAAGVVDVAIEQHPMPFATSTIRFSIWGTAVSATTGGGAPMIPMAVVSMNDALAEFRADALRPGRAAEGESDAPDETLLPKRDRARRLHRRIEIPPPQI